MSSAKPWATGGGSPCHDATSGAPSLSVNIADVYAPTAMKPAWPIENCPVNPFTRLSDTASTMLMPTSMRIWK